MHPPLLKQQLLEPTNLVQRLASRDVILSSWQNRKARKSSWNALDSSSSISSAYGSRSRIWLQDPVLTIRHCARLFLFWYARERGNHCFFDWARGREFLLLIAAAAVEILLENLWHGNLNLYFWIVHRKLRYCCNACNSLSQRRSRR